MAASDDVRRAGLLRRAGAIVIDVILVTLLLEAISTAAYPLSGGLVQFANGIQFEACSDLASVPKGFRVPAGFQPDRITHCSHRFIVFRTGESITLSRTEVVRGKSQTTKLTGRVATNGELITPIDIGALSLSLSFLLRWLFDCGPGTPGRRLCRNWLVPGDDIANAHGRAAQRRFGLRYLYLFLSILPASLVSSATTFPWSLRPGASTLDWITSLIGSTILLGPPILAIGAMLLRRDAYYDRFAGTHVVRG